MYAALEVLSSSSRAGERVSRVTRSNNFPELSNHRASLIYQNGWLTIITFRNAGISYTWDVYDLNWTYIDVYTRGQTEKTRVNFQPTYLKSNM